MYLVRRGSRKSNRRPSYPVSGFGDCQVSQLEPGRESKPKSPPAAGAGGAEGAGDRCYLRRYVRPPPGGLKDSTVCPAFFIAPAINPRTVCFCQPMVRMISDSVAPFLRRSMAMTSAFLLPRPATLTSGT